jgi:hypothetical protein
MRSRLALSGQASTPIRCATAGLTSLLSHGDVDGIVGAELARLQSPRKRSAPSALKPQTKLSWRCSPYATGPSRRS